MGGELALGAPGGPNRLLIALHPVPEELHFSEMALPKFTLAGLVSMSAGELVCVLEFHEAAPCTVSPCVTRATIEVSTPRMRKSWPLVPNARLPVSPGSKKPICTLFQFSWYSAPFHWKRWSKNSVFQPISLFVRSSEWYSLGIANCGFPSGPLM